MKRIRITVLTLLALAACLLLATSLTAQPPNPASPKGYAATQIGDHWIKVEYSRPILRGRQGIFGSGEEYGQQLLAGAPVWRAGADSNTRLSTPVALEIGGKKIEAGDYSLLIDLKEGEWTAILTQQPYIGRVNSREDVQKGMAEGKTWGAYGYDSAQDVVRAPMSVSTLDTSIDQMTVLFENVDAETGMGSLVVVWDNQAGSLPFKIAK